MSRQVERPAGSLGFVYQQQRIQWQPGVDADSFQLETIQVAVVIAEHQVDFRAGVVPAPGIESPVESMAGVKRPVDEIAEDIELRSPVVLYKARENVQVLPVAALGQGDALAAENRALAEVRVGDKQRGLPGPDQRLAVVQHKLLTGDGYLHSDADLRLPRSAALLRLSSMRCTRSCHFSELTVWARMRSAQSGKASGVSRSGRVTTHSAAAICSRLS